MWHLNEFKDFVVEGIVMEVAVGIIIGATFTAVVKPMLGDLINLIIGLFLCGVNFSNLFIVLQGDECFVFLAVAREAGAAVFAYGASILAVINFLIIILVVFIQVHYVNMLKDA